MTGQYPQQKGYCQGWKTHPVALARPELFVFPVQEGPGLGPGHASGSAALGMQRDYICQWFGTSIMKN